MLDSPSLFKLHFNIIHLSTYNLFPSGSVMFPSKPKPLKVSITYILCRFVFQMFYCDDQRGNTALLRFILSGMHLASSASFIIKATRAPSNKTGSKPVNCVDLQVNGARNVASVPTLRMDAADDLESSEWTVIDKITVELGRTRG